MEAARSPKKDASPKSKEPEVGEEIILGPDGKPVKKDPNIQSSSALIPAGEMEPSVKRRKIDLVKRDDKTKDAADNIR